MDNMRKAARELGMHENAIAVMKNINRGKYDYIMLLGDNNFIKGYELYVEEMEEIKSILVDLYYEMEMKQKLHKLSTLLFKKGLFKGRNSFMNSFPGTIFNTVEGFGRHSTFIKYRMIVSYVDVLKEKGEL